MLLRIPDVLTRGELEMLLATLGQAPFEDGAATAGHIARDVKRNLQVPENSDAGRKCAAVVSEALRRSPMFYSAALPYRLHGPIINRYEPGMTYGEHVDNAIMGAPPSVRTDVAATLFLSAPESYEGGELTVHDSFGVHRVKLPAGSMIVYPGNSIHRVEPISRGTRLAAVLWIQSLVRDQNCRRSLFELDISLGSLRSKLPKSPELATLTALYHNLLRMWGDT